MTPYSATRIAVTGWGSVTALGSHTAATWTRLIDGEGARGPITCFPVDGCRVTEGAEARLPSLPWLSPKPQSRLSRASRLALPAAREALAHAGLLDGDGRSRISRLEMSVSTTACGMELGEAFIKDVWKGSPQHKQAARVSRYQAQQQTTDISRHFGFTGPTSIISNACAGGANSLVHAADLIRAGLADIVLAGGYDALCELVFCGFDSLQSLSPDLCRPFDLNRNGLMLGEGAGFLVLESEPHAIRRGAQIRGVLAGYGHTTDTFHLTQPAADGGPLERAMQRALLQSGITPHDIGYVNAHGTGTPFNDRAEASAFARFFGEHFSQTRLSSTKAATGHTLGAAGSIEAIFCLMALQERRIPQQLHTQNPEPLVAGILAGPDAAMTKHATLSVNLGFGGSNAALIFTTP